jgi:hypothetical protein
MSGWFGGSGVEEDQAILDVSFLDAQSTLTGTNLIGGVSASERGNVTGMVFRTVEGLVPVGTRFVEFILETRAVTGLNDASADDLSFVFEPPAAEPIHISTVVPLPGAWAVKFQSTWGWTYQVERSKDLFEWSQMGAPEPGNGLELEVVDPTRPVNQAFYRLRVW